MPFMRLFLLVYLPLPTLKRIYPFSIVPAVPFYQCSFARRAHSPHKGRWATSIIE